MFKKAIALSTLSAVFFTGVLFTMMALLSKPPRLEKKVLPVTEQFKTGVVKEAYLTQADGSFLHEYLSAKASTFRIEKKEGKSELVENLEGISAVLEELITQNGEKIKQIRSFQAGHGIWDYTARSLRAKGAFITIVEAQKTGLKPVFQGQAESLDMDLKEGKPKFTIQGFKAKIKKDKP